PDQRSSSNARGGLESTYVCTFLFVYSLSLRLAILPCHSLSESFASVIADDHLQSRARCLGTTMTTRMRASSLSAISAAAAGSGIAKARTSARHAAPLPPISCRVSSNCPPRATALSHSTPLSKHLRCTSGAWFEPIRDLPSLGSVFAGSLHAASSNSDVLTNSVSTGALQLCPHLYEQAQWEDTFSPHLLLPSPLSPSLFHPHDPPLLISFAAALQTPPARRKNADFSPFLGHGRHEKLDERRGLALRVEDDSELACDSAVAG
ncbi:hypothetical protein C8R45DRAFT_1137927, partial [Mycena sanguinolenta]